MRCCTPAALDRAARERGTLAEQLPSGGYDRAARRAARARLAAVAELLPPADRELLAAVATPDEHGELPGPSTIGARLGIRRQSAAARRARLYRRIRRACAPPPPTPAARAGLPPAAELAAHLERAGAPAVGARRLARLLHGATAAEVATADGVTVRRVLRTTAAVLARLPATDPLADPIAAAVAARRGHPPR